MQHCSDARQIPRLWSLKKQKKQQTKIPNAAKQTQTSCRELKNKHDKLCKLFKIKASLKWQQQKKKKEKCVRRERPVMESPWCTASKKEGKIPLLKLNRSLNVFMTNCASQTQTGSFYALLNQRVPWTLEQERRPVPYLRIAAFPRSCSAAETRKRGPLRATTATKVSFCRLAGRKKME